ncbi:hypothetical protein NQ317_005568 [Molorchus minor]|uniref:Uncharacterized protein n=1 Tax=Molorchus minor TaxID=1323400 RepID=A0ABQ9IWW0_9CUCU|nr:hypothetical protein NQ317_005568 [Molorchus minor]
MYYIQYDKVPKYTLFLGIITNWEIWRLIRSLECTFLNPQVNFQFLIINGNGMAFLVCPFIFMQCFLDVPYIKIYTNVFKLLQHILVGEMVDVKVILPVSYKVESMLPLLDLTDKDELELKDDKYDDDDVDTEEKEAYDDSDD